MHGHDDCPARAGSAPELLRGTSSNVVACEKVNMMAKMIGMLQPAADSNPALLTELCGLIRHLGAIRVIHGLRQVDSLAERLNVHAVC